VLDVFGEHGVQMLLAQRHMARGGRYADLYGIQADAYSATPTS
jgi:hypothetical protein